MSRFKSLISAGLLATTMVFASIGAASADLAPNENNGTGPVNGHCIAQDSAIWIHNGHAPTLGKNAAGGERGAEIKNYQATCDHGE